MLPIDEQLARIRRGTEAIVPEEELRKKLARGKPLRVKYGIDPTGFEVHLGHTVPLRIMRTFQELGHKAVLIIGNYTALVGDPSGRDQSRARLTQEQVEQNAKDYLKQISRIIDIDAAEVRHNGEWFGRWSFLDVLTLLSKTTMQRMLERDDFTKRYRAVPSVPIYMHECLYPLMQGQDSVEIKADVELGGTEQLFNLMMGRKLQEEAGQEPQVCITSPILRGLDGGKKMGKSLGNFIGVGEPAYDQFAKTMSIPDDLLKEWFELLTARNPEEVQSFLTGHPMAAKKALGQDIVGFYHGKEVAAASQTEWEKRFSEKQDPTDIPETPLASSELTDGSIGVGKLLVLLGLAKSNNEARQKVTEGAVSIGPDRTKITDPKTMVAITDGLIVRLGARRIVRIKLN